jgi:hypothetical protein
VSDYISLALEETPRYEGAPTVAPYRVSTDRTYLPIQTARINPNVQLMDRSDELRQIEGGVSQLVETYEPDGNITMRGYVNALTWLLSIGGWSGTRTAGAGTNAVHTLTITGSPTGGFTTLTVPANFLGTSAAESVQVPWNATAAQLQALLEGLNVFLPGEVECAGGPWPTPALTIKYVGRHAAQVKPILTNVDSFTPSGTLAVTSSTAGAPGAVLDPDGKGVPTGASKWVFVKRGGNNAKTAEIFTTYKDENVSLKGQGFGVSNLTLNAAGDLGADLMGIVIGNVPDPLYAPTYDGSAIWPVRRGDLVLNWLAGSGTTDDFSLAISNPLVRVRTLGLTTPSNFADVLEHGDERVRVTGSIPKRVLADADVDALLGASLFSAKARWLVPRKISTSGAFFGLWIEMAACQYTGGQADELANRRRFGGTFDWWAAWDEAAGYDAKITLVNGISTIETYA